MIRKAKQWERRKVKRVLIKIRRNLNIVLRSLGFFLEKFVPCIVKGPGASY